MQEVHYCRSGGPGAEAADVRAVTVVFIADADKLVASVEDWPKVRHSNQSVAWSHSMSSRMRVMLLLQRTPAAFPWQ